MEDNIFENMTNRFSILLLFDFVFNFRKKKKFNLNNTEIVLRQYLDKSISHAIKNIILCRFYNR